MKGLRGALLALGLLLPGVLWAAVIDTYNFTSEAQEQQYRELTEQLRCPKCQNNSIADSNAIIASDMRQKVYELMQQGYNQQQVVDYMVARYGNFVTYEPPVTPATLILWIGPLLAILGGGWVLVRLARRRPARTAQRDSEAAQADLSEAERQRLRRLLNQEHDGEPR
ncbi:MULTISPECIES: cytochrome c-type biogenesis protein [Edwardsiella]|uniref:Cytochrome c-type biogenesis protein n=2 Tax=Edwardsiella anguillarum TaxID=1821960 RepID=A0A076LEJ8_9GAMM|nr:MULTISPECIES: cytochrome c-type biogenesis protein [Edwardsiella]AKM47284.1 cystathionine gamma-synthase [Edwardsiella sp. EA181011]GAJ65937.1 cytochrome c-type biogenesis protein [Edwardsiella piscicida]AIJ06965.1 Cytochrome c heme lyase subunit CcmL [Edwardsiella anguillarum ET080813]AKR78383.1 cytochrome c-type biogenesis protein CcmH [Edwardsiella sp. LADL05-105]KAB0593545.1 cytochrome c-type biogenesis protein CcmH [Edwardsiella anguillarum]